MKDLSKACADSSSVNLKGMNTCVNVGCTVLFIHASVSIALVRSSAWVGRKPHCGNLASRCWTIARICVITTPSSTSTGTCACGLIALYSADSFSRLCSFTITGSNAAPLASSKVWGTKEHAPCAKYSFIVMGAFLESSAARTQRYGSQRGTQLVQPGPQRVVNGGDLQQLAFGLLAFALDLGRLHATHGQHIQ